MTKKQPGIDLLPRKKRRAGEKRILWHIVLFGMLGILLLAGGLYGREALHRRAEGFRIDSRVTALHRQGLDGIKKILLGSLPEKEDQKIVNRVVTSKKRGLKNSLQALVEEGKSDEEGLKLIASTVLSSLKDQVSPDAYRAMEQALEQHRDEARSAILAAMQENEKTLSISYIRKELPVTTKGYPLMYYSGALIKAGVVLLGLMAALLIAYLTLNEDGKARLAAFLEPMDYLMPFFVGVLIFTLYPIVRVVIMSFQERYKLDGSFSGWGLGNYQYVLKGVEGTSNYFMQGLVNTMLYVLLTVPLTTALAVVIAYLLNQKLRLSALFQTAYFLPMVTSVTAVGLVWRWIFNYNFGILNAIIVLFGGTPINWLQASANSMAVMVIFGVWNTLPFTIILLLSGLQNIDETYYTVARVDGAGAMRIFRRITVPLLAPTIGLVLTINSISAFKVFTEVTVLFNGNPGPAYNMYTVVYYIYEMMHQRLELGRAAAAAIVLFVFIFVFTMLQRLIQRKWNYT